MHLVPESLYLTISIIDRFLSRECVPRKRLQLVGTTSLLIACKYEETKRIYADDFSIICNDAYTKKELLTMELLVVCTGYNFLQRFLHITKATCIAANLASYYMGRIQLEYSLLDLRPSHLAAAAVSLALNNPGLPENKIKMRWTYHTYHQVIPTVPGVVRTNTASRSPYDYS